MQEKKMSTQQKHSNRVNNSEYFIRREKPRTPTKYKKMKEHIHSYACRCVCTEDKNTYLLTLHHNHLCK